MTDGFEEHIGCEEWGERCDMRGTEQDEDSEGRIYRTYRVRRVCGRTGGEFGTGHGQGTGDGGGDACWARRVV